MGQALWRARDAIASKAKQAAAGGSEAPTAIGRSKLVDKERPLRYVSPAARSRPLLDDLNSLNEIIRRDHMKAAAAGVLKTPRRSPWADRGMSVEEYAEELRKSRMAGMQLPQPESAASEDREWDRSHPNYKFMAEELAKKIQSTPVFETPVVTDPGPKPQNRGASRPKEESIPGKLKLEQLKEVFLLRHGRAEGEPRPLDADEIARRFNIDAALLKKVFSYTSLAEPVVEDVEEQKQVNTRLRA